jgi:hypothetical protein
MRPTLSCYLCVLLNLPILSAQHGYGDKWVIGNGYTFGAILDFSTQSLNIDTSFQKNMEFEGTCAVMCDSLGQLLFYSNGCYIANAQGQPMKNGDGFGLGVMASFCNTGGAVLRQAMISLPKPKHMNKYSLIYEDVESVFDSIYFPLAPIHIYYAEIDMEAEQGQGAVTKKHEVVISDTLDRGHITAQRHANGSDWWIVVPEKLSNCYWTVLLTENGIDTTFKQCIGTDWDDNDGAQVCFAPSGRQYARGNDTNGLLLMDFDNVTGYFSNAKVVSLAADTFTFHYSGIAFSPNSRFLYLSSVRKLWQYDLLAPDLEQSRVQIGVRTSLPGVPSTSILSMMLAPDGKIYIGGSTSFNHLHAIQQPNCKGLDCQFEQYAVDLRTQCVFTIPNAPNYIPWPQDTSMVCISSTDAPVKNNAIQLLIAPNPVIDKLHVYVPEEMIGKTNQYQIVDINGRVLFEEPFKISELHIPIQSLSAGLYWLRIVSDQSIELAKFIKSSD